MEKIIHFTIPERSTPIQLKAIERARELHPDWEVRVWQDPVQPDGYLLERYWPKANSGAQFADLLRLDLVYRWGGVYVDSDLLLLKPLDELAARYDCFLASEDGTYLTNALFGAARTHPAILAVINELLAHEPDWSSPVWITTGPKLFSDVLRANKAITVLPRETFYSYNWDEPDLKRNHRHSYGEHLWAKSWWSPETRDHFEPQKRLSSLTQAARRFAKLTLSHAFRVWQKTRSVNISSLGRSIFHSEPAPFDGRAKYRDSQYARFLNTTVRGGDWIVDVDANASFSAPAARAVNMFGRVFAYEPNRHALASLQKSVIANDVQDHIVTRAVRVGNQAEHAATDASTELAGVPCKTLDEEFPVDLPIKLLRINTPGRELAVLQGARRLLERRCLDFILIEPTYDQSGSGWKELISQLTLLTESGYAVCTLSEDGSLLDHESVSAAVNQSDKRVLVLVAREQYTAAA